METKTFRQELAGAVIRKILFFLAPASYAVAYLCFAWMRSDWQLESRDAWMVVIVGGIWSVVVAIASIHSLEERILKKWVRQYDKVILSALQKKLEAHHQRNGWLVYRWELLRKIYLKKRLELKKFIVHYRAS